MVQFVAGGALGLSRHTEREVAHYGDHFSPTFLWGSATAAHQVEGGNVYNDYWVLEHVPGSPYVESLGDACDHYHRYRDDIALLADLDFTLYRFSLEWSRITQLGVTIAGGTTRDVQSYLPQHLLQYPQRASPVSRCPYEELLTSLSPN